MKTKITRALTLMLLVGLAFSAFADDRTFKNPIGGGKKSYFYYTPSDNENFAGDPMPFYDYTTQTFRIPFLRDERSGSTLTDGKYHPVSMVTTKDAATYTEGKKYALVPDNNSGAGTGGAVFHDNRWFLFYGIHTDGNQVIKRAHLNNDNETWDKDEDFPKMSCPSGYMTYGFRDPCIVKLADNDYRMLVSATTGEYDSGKDEHGAVLREYKSDDVMTWTDQGVFINNLYKRFYECPDVFKMGDKWYLVYSDMGSEYDGRQGYPRYVKYFVADTYEGLKSTQTQANESALRIAGKLDGQQFYAGKTASDGTNRYIWGWCATRNGQQVDHNEAEANFGGALVVHKVKQNSDGSLALVCPDAIRAMLHREVTYREDQTVAAGNKIEMPRMPSVARITFNVTTENKTSVFGLQMVDCSNKSYDYRICIEDKYSCLKFKKGSETIINELPLAAEDQNGTYNVEVIVDHSICVFYINGQYAFTNRIYGMENNPFSFFCSEGSVNVTNLKLFTNSSGKTLFSATEHNIGEKGGFWDDGSPSVVANTDNKYKSDKCLQFTGRIAKLPIRDVYTGFSFDGYRRISMMVKKPTNATMCVELSDPTNDTSEGAKYWVKSAAEYTGGNEWQRVIFDFSKITNEKFNDYPGVMTIYSTLEESSTETLLIDDIRAEASPEINSDALSEIANASISGKATLQGSWLEGDNWQFDGAVNTSSKTDTNKHTFSEITTATSKMTDGITEVDMRGCSVYGSSNATSFAQKNPNVIIYKDMQWGSTDNNVVVGGHADRLMVDDSNVFNASEQFTAWDATVKHAFTAGNWSTCVLPFYPQTTAQESYNAFAENGTVAKFSSVAYNAATHSLSLKFISENNQYFDANRPFLYRANTTKDSHEFKDVKVVETPVSQYINVRQDNDGCGVDFIGILEKSRKLADGDIFINSNKFYVATEKTQAVKSQRAYFKVYEPAGESLIRTRITDFFVDDECHTTGISGVVETTKADGIIYDLYGRRVMTEVLQSGKIYVKGGKKYVRKD